MTDEEALKILREAREQPWIGWDDEADRPDWRHGSIVLDGRFTPSELRAVLHFLLST